MRQALMIVSAVIIAAVSLTWLAFARDLRQAEARLEGRSQVVTTSFGQVEYAEAGTGEPMLLIHGTGGGFDQGLEFGAGIVEAGFRVIAPSRFGYLGSSFPDNPTTALQADALDELLAKIGEREVVIFGGSAGALSAMQLAIRHPERCRALVLLVPAAYAPDRAANTAGAPSAVMTTVIEKVLPNNFLFWAAIKLAPGTMTKLLLATEPALVAAADPVEQERVANVLEHIFPVAPRARGLLFDASTAGNAPRYALEEIRCPVLTISAEDDLFGTAPVARYVAEEVPDGRLVMFPEGGHILVGHSADADRAIAEFIRSLPPVTERAGSEVQAARRP